MKKNQNHIVLFGQDEYRLATRQWVLQSRGYKVSKIVYAAEVLGIPEIPAISVLLVCDSVPKKQAAKAQALAEARWPGIQCSFLVEETGRTPSGILGQLLHTMEGPAKLLAIVEGLIGTSENSKDSGAAA